MKYNVLGRSGVSVSRICLGTMTWGEQNTPQEAFEQMDYALTHGVNFWDTAELYSVPPKAQTYGVTETIIGDWFAQDKSRRDKVILASKIAGPGEFVAHIRHGQTAFRPSEIEQALDQSLARLQTDYIDLYQLHWPTRQTNYFGQLGFQVDVDTVDQENTHLETQMQQTLEALHKALQAGKIRAIGLSNETAWGVMTFLRLARSMGIEEIVSVQNPYNLLNRSYEVGLAEVSMRERVGLLAYSPLGFGVLSGKYLHGKCPPNSRLDKFPHYDRYSNPQAVAATQAYAKLAREVGLSPTQLALAFINQQPFVTSNIIGATNLQQLSENIASMEVELSEDVLSRIELIHQHYPNPSP